jgi:hypothetical protein
MKKIAFTIVLNGMPFIKNQFDIIPKIFDEWHIIEGATLPVLDTKWCKNIDNNFYDKNKLSIDGTSQFLDSIVDNKKIFIHRKNNFWQGKLEMCNKIKNIMENCILMQIDVDEFWKPDILKNLLEFCEKNEGFDGMMFKCNFYVGENLVITTENTYGDMPYEWFRLWKIKEKTEWISHEPPKIKNCYKFLSKDFTKNKGWIFDHYAYVNKEQLKFKENFYGYKDAVKNWETLQNCENFPCKLKDYLNWVDEASIVNKINEK